MNNNIKVDVVKLGVIKTNCYIIYKETNKKAIIVDPGENADLVIETMNKLGVSADSIILTHGHYDHIGAVDELRERLNIKAYIYKDEQQLVASSTLNMSEYFGRKIKATPDVFLEDDQVINLADINIKVIHTPGHTPGGCCYYFYEDGFLISGDTLFEGTYGRCDLPGGSEGKILSSIKNKLLILDDDVVVYPGHEEATTIIRERQNY